MQGTGEVDHRGQTKYLLQKKLLKIANKRNPILVYSNLVIGKVDIFNMDNGTDFIDFPLHLTVIQ
jgi:hypothetical protein